MPGTGHLRRRAATRTLRRPQVRGDRTPGLGTWRHSGARCSPRPRAIGMVSGRLRPPRPAKRREADRTQPRLAAAAEPTGIGRRRVRWNPAAAARPQAATGADHTRGRQDHPRVPNWICGNRSRDRHTVDIRAAATALPAATVSLVMLRAMADRTALPAMVDRTVPPAAVAIRAPRAAVAADTPLEVVVGTPAAAAVGTPAVAATAKTEGLSIFSTGKLM